MEKRSRKIADSLADIRQSLNSTLLSDKPGRVPAPQPGTPNIATLENEVSSVVDQHEELVNHLQRQVTCYKESLAALRDRCEVLVGQNQALHKELEQHISLDVTDLGEDTGGGELLGGPVGAAHSSLLQHLLDQRGVYEQQVSALQRQVSLLRAELRDAEQQVEDYKHMPPVQSAEPTPDSKWEQEREEMETALMSLQSLVEVMRGREEEAMGKVKKSVEMVDRARSDQESLEIKLKRSTDELNRVRERHSVQVTQAKAELQQSHDEAMAEMKENLREKERELTAAQNEIQRAQLQLDAGERERADLTRTVERYREQGLTSLEVVDKTSQQLRDQLRAALGERDEAINAVALNKNSVQLELHDRQREVTQLQGELTRCRGRLTSSEETVRKLTLDTATLNDEVANLKIAMNKTINDKVSLEKTNSLTIEHLKLVSSQTQATSKAELEECRARHSETVSQLQLLLSQQQSLATKWRNAHCESTKQFEESSAAMAQELNTLRKEHTVLAQKYQAVEKKLSSMSQKTKTLRENEKKMTKSLKLAESHIIKTAEELYSVVQNKNNLLRERTVMAKEIELLQTQLCDVPQYIPKLDMCQPEKDMMTS
eukprot:sb/3463188/